MPLEFLSPLHKATRQITVYLETQTGELGVSPVEGHVLTYLGGYAPVPVGELSRVFGLKGSTLTSLLDRLEAAGLLRRDANPRDRRSRLVKLTPAGEEVTTVLNRCLMQLEEDIRASAGAGDVAGFHAVMRAIADVTRVELRQR